MTIIGKILTFLIFVFSLLFLGFAIIINNTNKDPRTKQSWYERVKVMEVAEKNFREDLLAKEQELTSLRSQIVAAARELAETKARIETERSELNSKVSVAENAMNNAITKFQQSQVVIATIQADIEKKTKENLDLSDRIKQLDIKLADLNQKNTTEKNLRIAAQIERDTTKARLTENEAEITRLAREVETIRDQRSNVPGPGNLAKPQPPPVDVQGVVTAVTSDGAYISINKGSDHGLAKSQTLEVYRLSPKPEWVARIRIMQVSNHEAVGMVVEPQNRKPTVLKGDQVGSSILPTSLGR